MKQNNMIADNQVMTSSLYAGTSISLWYLAQTNLKKNTYFLEPEYIPHLCSASTWKSLKKDINSPNTYKHIQLTNRLHHHLLPCNILILWTFPYKRLHNSLFI